MINNYFSDYKSNSNSDNKLRLYKSDKSNNKRLYVSKYLIGKYLILSDNKSDNKSLIVELSDNKSGLKVNNQAFISLNKLSDNVYNKLLSKSIIYGDKINKIINK